MLIVCLVFFPMVLAVGLYWLNRPVLQQWGTLAALLAGCVGAVALTVGTASTVPLVNATGLGFTVTGFGHVYCVVASVLWLVSTLVSRDTFASDDPHLRRYYAALLFTYGATLGVFLAADLCTLLVCFELMSFASYLWVIHKQTDATVAAGESYLTFAVLGGLTLLFGLAILYAQHPDLTIATLSTNFATPTPLVLLAGFFLFVGFAIKAGGFFLHDWLPLAYTAAPAPATAILTGVLSKLGVYGIAIVAVQLLPSSVVFTLFLLTIALLNMLGGAIFAFLSTDLKTTLAFSSISQIGFILWGVALCNLLGEHGAIAAYGTVFYMVSHSLSKLVLFSVTGVVETTCGTTDLNQITGFGRQHLWMKVTFAIAGLSLAGVPLLSGYLSKTLLHEAMVEYMALSQAGLVFSLCEWGFLVAGGFTLAYMTKLFVCLFCREAVGAFEPPVVSKISQIALSLVAATLVALGLSGNGLMATLGGYTCAFFGVHTLESVAYFSLTNLLGSATSITIGVLVYVFGSYLFPPRNGLMYVPYLRPEWAFQEVFYKPVYKCLVFVGAIFLRILDILVDGLAVVFQRLAFQNAKIPQAFFSGDFHNRKTREVRFHLTYSLAYSLLMFGLGFLFTIIYLLVVGSM